MTNSAPQYRECPHCGSPTPLETARCIHCGALSVEAAVAARQAAQDYRFFRTLFTRSNQSTMLFLGINLGVFLLEWLAGGMAAMSVDPGVLIGFGAKQNALIIEQHQYWRLVTCMFIHIGFLHFFLNNYALWIIGKDIEQLYGSGRFLILYVATGVMASLSSFYFSPDAVSAGASGAIFGLFGVIATFAFKYRREVPVVLSRDIRRRVLPIIAINLVFGFVAREVVDNAAHVGGLVSGVALALLVPFKRPDENRTPVVWRALMVVCLTVVVVSLSAAFRNYHGPRLSLANLSKSPGAQVVEYYKHMSRAESLFQGSVNSFVQALRDDSDDLAAASGAVEEGLKTAHAAPRIPGEADAFRERLIELLNDQKSAVDLYSQSEKRSKRNAVIVVRRIQQNYEKFRDEFYPWLTSYLQEHGYELREQRSGD